MNMRFILYITCLLTLFGCIQAFNFFCGAGHLEGYKPLSPLNTFNDIRYIVEGTIEGLPTSTEFVTLIKNGTNYAQSTSVMTVHYLFDLVDVTVETNVTLHSTISKCNAYISFQNINPDYLQAVDFPYVCNIKRGYLYDVKSLDCTYNNEDIDLYEVYCNYFNTYKTMTINFSNEDYICPEFMGHLYTLSYYSYRGCSLPPWLLIVVYAVFGGILLFLLIFCIFYIILNKMKERKRFRTASMISSDLSMNSNKSETTNPRLTNNPRNRNIKGFRNYKRHIPNEVQTFVVDDSKVVKTISLNKSTPTNMNTNKTPVLSPQTESNQINNDNLSK